MTAPKLPAHPEHCYVWTEAEKRAIEAWGLAVREQALEDAAKACDARRDARFQEYGITEPDTGAQYYGRDTGEHEFDYRDEEDDDCASSIRAIAAKEKT